MAPASEPVLYYDFNSPYAHLAFFRAERVLGVKPVLQPVALAFIHRARGRVPWSMRDETRDPGLADCQARARSYGMPPLRIPPGWPVESYSLAPLRAAVAASRHGPPGALTAFSAAAFNRHFLSGKPLLSAEDLAAVALVAGLDAESIIASYGSEEIKAELTRATQAAIDLGIYGVPSVRIGERLFWGDDQLPAAAADLSDTACH